MNWFNLLKNKSGKLVMSTQKALIISAGVGIVGATLMQNLVMPSDSQDMQVRSLASVSNNFDYSGMRQSADRTGLTSISVSDESGTFKAAQGTIPAGDFGLKGADNLDAKVSSAFDGKGGKLSDTEGLGKSRDVDLSQTASVNGQSGKNAPSRRSYSPRGGNSGTDDSYSSSASGRTAEPTQIASLGSASMARASGSGINASYGDFSSGSSSSSGSRGSSSRTSGGKSSGSSYNFSGAMPGSTVSLGGADGRSSSRFTAGAVNASVSGGSQSGSLKNELKDISKRSADAATLAGRGDASNTEGARAFMNGSQSHGLEILTETKLADTGSIPDFDKQATKSTQSSQDNINNTVTPKATEQGKMFTKLVACLIATLVTLLIGMAIIAALGKKWPWGTIASIVVSLGVLTVCAGTFALARKYYLEFGRDGWVPPVMWSLSGLVIGGLGFAWLSACVMKKNVIKEFVQKHGKGAIKGIFKDSLGMGGKALKDVIKEEMNPNSQTNQQEDKK